MYDEFKEKVIVEPLATKPRDRIDNDVDMAAYVEGMLDYLAKRGVKGEARKELQPTTTTTWVNGIWCIYHAMGNKIEFSDAFVRDAKKTLETYISKKTGRPLTVATRITYLWALEQFMRANWDRNYRVIKPDQGEVSYTDPKRFFTADEVKRILTSIQITDVFSVRDRALMYLMYFAALRNNETINLWYSDYDEKSGIITVQSHPAHAGVPAFRPKRGKTRQVHLPDKAKAVLDEWIKVRRERNIEPDSPFVFITGTRNTFTPRTLNDVVHKYCKPLELHGYPHKMRKSRCWHLLNVHSWPITVVCDFMGHSSIETTKRYCASDVQEQRLWLRKTEKDDV